LKNRKEKNNKGRKGLGKTKSLLTIIGFLVKVTETLLDMLLLENNWLCWL